MTFRAFTIVAGALALVASACASRAGAPEAPATVPASASHVATPAAAADGAPSTPPAAQAHAACAPAPSPPPAGDSDHALASGGEDRRYILHLPPAYDGARRMPLVLNFHGFGSNARQQAAYSGLPAKADRAGFIVVTPDGTGEPRRWNFFPGSADIVFVRELIADLETTLCVDAARIFATGISNGAAFSARLACDLPDRIRAIAMVAATVYPARCEAPRAVPVVAFQGTDDPCVPFEGGTSACGMQLPVPAAEEAAKNWARHGGCNLEPPHSQVTEHVRAVAYSECREVDAAVVLYIIYGGGHTWPGAVDVARLGATTQEISATDLMWEFFAGRE